MSMVRKCDLCGREFQKAEVIYRVKEIKWFLNQKNDLDFCRSCFDRLREEVEKNEQIH